MCFLQCRDCEPNAGRRRLRVGGEVETGLERLLLDLSSQCAHILGLRDALLKLRS